MRASASAFRSTATGVNLCTSGIIESRALLISVRHTYALAQELCLDCLQLGESIVICGLAFDSHSRMMRRYPSNGSRRQVEESLERSENGVTRSSHD